MRVNCLPFVVTLLFLYVVRRQINCEISWEEGDAGCPKRAFKFGNFCYELESLTIDYHEAFETCAARGGILAPIKDEETHYFILKLRIKSYLFNYWIGLSDRGREGVFMYSDNKPLGDFNKWLYGQPKDAKRTDNCVEMATGTNYLWRDDSCSKENLFICQFSDKQCSSKSHYFRQNCYTLSQELVSYVQAVQKCSNLGGTLAAVKDNATHEFLKTLIQSERWWKNMNKSQVEDIYEGWPLSRWWHRSWFGLHLDGDVWTFSDGSDVGKTTFQKWETLSKLESIFKEECALIDLKWQKFWCGSCHSFICRYPEITTSGALPISDETDQSSGKSENQETISSTTPRTLKVEPASETYSYRSPVMATSPITSKRSSFSLPSTSNDYSISETASSLPDTTASTTPDDASTAEATASPSTSPECNLTAYLLGEHQKKDLSGIHIGSDKFYFALIGCFLCGVVATCLFLAVFKARRGHSFRAKWRDFNDQENETILD